MSVCEIKENGAKVWRNEAGQYHREDGPAIEYADGTNAWCIDGMLHREDGPAIEWENGDKEWYLNGQYHREDGPAVERANGSRHWYLNDKKYTFKRYCNELLKRKLITENNLVLFQIRYNETSQN